jgi:serine/threonine-protein phosphatase 4 catalytic subunit
MALDLDKAIDGLRRFVLPAEAVIEQLCAKAKEVLSEEPNVVPVQPPVSVVGRAHGHFDDLVEIFETGGDIPSTSYIFLGNYVSKGPHSIELFLLLLCFKLRHPKSVTLLRGTHDCRATTRVYGFYDECCYKFGSVNVWRLCTDVFDYLCLCAIIDDSVLCVHGGLSPSCDTIDQIQALTRTLETPNEGAMTDLLWSDPDDDIQGWSVSARGAGYVFGPDIADNFLYTNQLDLIARSHMLGFEGYRYYLDQTVVDIGFPNDKNMGAPGAIMTVTTESTVDFTLVHPRPQHRRKGRGLVGEDHDYRNSDEGTWGAWYDALGGSAVRVVGHSVDVEAVSVSCGSGAMEAAPPSAAAVAPPPPPPSAAAVAPRPPPPSAAVVAPPPPVAWLMEAARCFCHAFCLQLAAAERTPLRGAGG